MSQGTFQMRLR